ncbi:dynein axonemal heavy chain 8 [Cydia pomonella]|uniref:dynein axonemal heavy chain 8 n=1 Tax=Cydia pomonella TaxID=82600 RepID=UPI002ADDEDE8|nr:dynein axonemal heavy chain 8 [Cydia pomonella]
MYLRSRTRGSVSITSPGLRRNRLLKTMADEAGGAEAPPAEAPETSDEKQRQEDIEKTAEKIESLTHIAHRKASMFPQTQATQERVEVDRTALEAILDVGSRLKDIQKKSKVSMSALALGQESYKEKQAKAKEARNNRVGGLKTQHRFLLEMAGAILNRSADYVLEGVYDADIHIDLLDSAVAEGGRNCIVLCDALLPPVKMESGRFVPNQKGRMERTYISDASSIGTCGRCVAMYRIKNKLVDTKNVADDYYLVFIDMDQERENVVSGVFKMLTSAYVPALKACKAWGDINPPNPKSDDMIKTYLSRMNLFFDYLAKTKIDLDCCTRFKVNEVLYEEHLSDEEKMKVAITKTYVLEEICTFVKQWMKQITMVLVQSQQLRREPSNIGPLAELDHWRRQLTTFTSIIEHIKSDLCQMYIHTLIRAKSKLIKKWRLLDNQVTDYYNEAFDNVKYLYALEKYCEPLYRCDPHTMEQYIPGLLYTVRMVYATSRYYNTTKQISTLLVKVTNQILNMCMDYLTNNGRKTIWNQDKLNFNSKALFCLGLYSFYRECYDETQKEMHEAADEKPFGCSEMYIFGKFETFRRRLIKIIDLFQTYITYYILNKTTLEGIEEHASLFNKFFKAISTKTYDALDHRRPDFDKDYKIYKDAVANQEVLLENFMINSVNKCPTTEIALHLLKRFDNLKLGCLYLEDQYYDLISKFTAEIESLRDRYNEERENPDVPWNMPPVSGRIMWIRFYDKNIQGPMAEFKKQDEIITHMNTQRCIKLFNVMYIVFTEFELIYHKAWAENVGQVRLGLIAPLLIRHPTTNMYIVNFNIYIPECIREVEYMWQLGLSVPDSAQVVAYCKDQILGNFEKMKYLVDRNNKIRKSMPKLYLPLLRAQLVKMEKAFQPGLSTITWTSLEIPAYCTAIEVVLDEVDLFVKEVVDIKEARIDAILQSIAKTLLVLLPEQAVEPNVFYEDNLTRRDDIANELQHKSWNAETAVIELINKFLDSVPSQAIKDLKDKWLDPDKALKPVTSATRVFPEDAAFLEIENPDRFEPQHAINESNELFAYFATKCFESLIKCTRTSLDLLRRRASVSSFLTMTTDPEEQKKLKPLMKTMMYLQIPRILITPTLDEIQSAFSQVVLNCIMDTHRNVFQWSQQELILKEGGVGSTSGKSMSMLSKSSIGGGSKSGSMIGGVRSYFRMVSEHKDIVRAVMALQGMMYMYKPDIEKLLKDYGRYSFLWAEDRVQQVQDFVDSNPLNVIIRDMLKKYEGQTEEVNNLPERHIIGSIQINTDNVKLGLHVESIEWKRILGKLLSVAYKERVLKMMQFINDRMKAMAKKIKDLDDVRVAMLCLEMIREAFIDMDMELDLIEESYTTFHQFNIDISKEDSDMVDGLRYAFTNMLETAASVQQRIVDMQGPLQKELTSGVSTFMQEVLKFDADYDAFGPMTPGLTAREASDRVILFQSRFDELWRRFEMYSSGEKLFGMEVKDYPILHEKKKQFNLLNKLYSLYLSVMNSIDGYFETPWIAIDIETIINQLAEFDKRCRMLPRAMKDWPAFIELKTKIDDFNQTCPLLELMADKSMKDRHWKRLEKLLGCILDVESETFTLANVMEAPLLKYKEDVEDICISSVKEKDIESKLKQVMVDWAVVDLTFAPFKNRGDLLIKAQDTLDIITMLEDSLMVLNSLASNRYNAPFKKDIILWINKLVSTSEILEKWLIVQNLWMYLEAVFVGGDIAKQLPAEAKRFATIDKTYVKIMYRARDIINCVETCTSDDSLKQLLPHLLEQLEACQKSLTGYLETKRLIFPRFFFVSDPVLLEILGQASDPHSIQPHLPSIFDALNTVDFDDKERIVNMNSDNGEKIPLERPVVCMGGVENWLNVLLDTMKDTVRNVIASISQTLAGDPEFDFLVGFWTFPGQAGLLGMQILWTSDAEYALKKARADRFIMRLTNQKFLDLLNGLIDYTVKDLTPLDRTQIETMITIHVHQRDIFDDLVKLRIKSPGDFEWQKQARFYYYEDSDDCLVCITDVIFLYQNEYLGITERLVITPLTDRCYITLSQAIGMNMGGAPAGPAGTGKTETTKDMARTLGKLVIVFNCSDQMDFRGLGRIYKGLAQSGTWGCFDEFNRIELPVLSVAAQQIYICLTARKEKKEFFLFSDGDTVSLNPEFAFIITMNPGYAGRQELPENLKIQFRSVAMMVPDRQIIIRVKLASCGFKENILLARKFFTLYKLCEEQLSKQVHYDFGLRNILSVLRTMGAQKRANPDNTEENIMMRVLKEMNVSKLVDEDEPLFVSLIEDLFPGMKLTQTVQREMQRAITLVTERTGLVNHPDWNLKIIQLYETSLVRHGLMTMGPTGSGKTTCIHSLMAALTVVGRPHRENRMNPKAITAPQMFGRLDVATNDWTDGIFSTLWRRALKVKKSDTTWIVLDGPVDAVWIENLNSVLDDNKTLTLANGDRISMASNSKLVFEPDNVDNASPATVSRMGMVFLSSSVLKWQPILEGWLKKRSQKEADSLRNAFNKIYDEVHAFVQQKLPAKMKLLEAIYVRQCIDVLTGLLSIEIPSGKSHTDRHLERLFIFAMMWSLGAVLELDARTKMAEFFTKLPAKMDYPGGKSKEWVMPFEFMVNPAGQWQHWSESVEDYIYPTDSVPEYASILVPNVDNVCISFLIDTIAKQNKAVLLIGEQGTAKTVMLKSYMAKYDNEVKLFKMINFSSATTPNMFQRIIESYVEKRVGMTYGPPGNRAMTVFVDDINMPIVNEWGDQVTNEIVRQMMECGGFYSLEKPGEFIIIADIQMFGAMIHPGGGRNDIPPRLKRQFNVFNCTLPSDVSMDKIFETISAGYFCKTRFDKKLVDFMPKLVPVTRVIWQQTKAKMLPTPAKFHYVFNLRDLSRIWEGILFIKREELQSVNTALKLWFHECLRVISDRFTTFDDKDWFVENFWKTATKELPEYVSEFPEGNTYFVNFLREPADPTGDEEEEFSFEAPKIYEELPSWEFVLMKLGSFQELYNEQVRGASLDLVFFLDAMVHLFIVSRIINTPRGNALLVGVGGSGKQSLTKLASFIANFSFYQITLTRSYNVSNFMDDIKYLYRVAGLQGKGISFIFTDNDIKDEQFLEFLNNILSSGEIANLFAKDEMDEILNELTPIMKKYAPRRIPVPDVLYEYFIMRSRANLHVVLCFSPVGEKFRSRAMKFPGLISGSVMDWFQKWPKQALIEVADHFLREFHVVCAPETKIMLIEIMGMVQDDVAEACIMYYDRFRRQAHVTPKSYLSFLEGYKVLYKEKHENIAEMARRMTTGLDKLVEAAASVDILKKELELKGIEIEEATAKAEEVLQAVAVSQAAAEVVKGEVLEVKDRAVKLVAVIAAETAIAEEKLAAARPALEAAEAALLTINAGDIATVRKLGKPPFLITLIMDAVIILFRKKIDPIKPDPEKNFLSASWAESLKVMADSRFLNNLKFYPKDEINAEMVDLLQPYFQYPQYTFEAAKVACGNVAGLISWTIAMAQFYSVNKDVLPLKANLAVMQGKYQAAKRELDTAEGLLAAKERELAGVQRQFDEAMTLKQAVLDDAAKCQEKMDVATCLINGLSGERIRWTEQSALFKSEIERLIGDIVLLCGFLSYSGPFNQEFRQLLIKNWLNELIRRKIPVSMNLNITEQLTDTATIGEWNLCGLPTDDLSIQNGIIVTKAARFPLLIDPQTQGKNWIKNMEKFNDLIVTTLNHKYFRNHVEDCVSLGRPMLIEDVAEELDPALDNILEKNYIKIGSSYKVKLGDKEIDVTAGHKIYITTKLPNPAYTPEVSARTSIIDFTVTMQGLEDQLLGRVILTEKAEMEAERTQLIKDVTANRRKMQELEANLLHKLTTIQGSLVEDVSLIQVLNITKSTATEVKEKLDIAKETEIKINLAREEFRPVATRGSVLYFLICNMSLVCNMYQTSLAQFLERFDISMERSQPSPITQRRIGFIIDYLTFDVFKYISRGFYETHKYLFTLLLTLKIDMQREYVSFIEFQTLIKGGAALDLNACPPKPFKWITDMSWLNLVYLTGLRQFTNILNQITNNEKGWKNWFDKEAPEEETLPDGYHTLDVFRKLLVVRSWSPDRTLAQSLKYVVASMGQRYSEAVIVNYEHMVLESRPLVPLIGFLAMGSDPTPNIEVTAKRLECLCSAISMGQGQEVHARKLIERALKEGMWVLLQNCHLGLEYMVEVMEQFAELEKEPEKVSDIFRLWITTEVHPKFPITLLQMSIKYTCEPPSGIKAGLMRTYDSMSQDFLDYSDSPYYLPLIYTISFLHTVVQERRKFGPLGWNIPYEFNSADWLASCMFVQNHLDGLEQGEYISWTTVRYMVSAVQYGGRVTDDYDNRLLVTFCRVWFTDQLFTEDFQFYKGYGIMKFKNIPEYLEEIEKMKTVDPPQAYGLHTNADITYQRSKTQTLLDTILSIQPKESGGGGGESREASVYRQSKEMLEKIPPNFDPFQVKERLRIMGQLNSMVIFLRQEIDRMQKVIGLVRTTLRDLLLAIDGTIIMNEALRNSLDSIYDAKVPVIWLKSSWSSSTLGFWFTEFLERNIQFSSWCFIARPNSFWMTGFFNPQGFLTAMRQEVTRAHKGWALDMVALHNDVTKFILDDVKAPPPEGVYVHGLYLDGASWDRRNLRLCESTLKVLYTALPVIHVYAINSTAPKDPKLYTCPVYKKPVRTGLTFITPLWLPTIKNPDHWVLRGVAILCDIK